MNSFDNFSSNQPSFEEDSFIERNDSFDIDNILRNDLVDPDIELFNSIADEIDKDRIDRCSKSEIIERSSFVHEQHAHERINCSTPPQDKEQLHINNLPLRLDSGSINTKRKYRTNSKSSNSDQSSSGNSSSRESTRDEQCPISHANSISLSTSQNSPNSSSGIESNSYDSSPGSLGSPNFEEPWQPCHSQLNVFQQPGPPVYSHGQSPGSIMSLGPGLGTGSVPGPCPQYQQTTQPAIPPKMPFQYQTSVPPVSSTQNLNQNFTQFQIHPAPKKSNKGRQYSKNQNNHQQENNKISETHIQPNPSNLNNTTPLSINDIDPNKPLQVNSHFELERLIQRKIVITKTDHSNGNKFYELNVDELRRQQRLQKNRVSASESRRRQRDYIKLLEEKVIFLEKENNSLKEKLNNLEQNSRQTSTQPQSSPTTRPKYTIGPVKNLTNVFSQNSSTTTATTGTITNRETSITSNNPRKTKILPPQNINHSLSGQPFAKMPKLINQSQFALLLTCLTCVFCLFSGGFTNMSNYNYSPFSLMSNQTQNLGQKSSNLAPESHKLSKRSTNKNNIPSISEMNSNFQTFPSFSSRSLSSFSSGNSNNNDEIMSKDLLSLLNSPIVLKELESRINSGQICNFMNNRNEKNKKYRIFQKRGNKISKVKGEPSFDEQRNQQISSSDCESSFRNSTINRLDTITIRNNFRHFAEIYNRSSLIGAGAANHTTDKNFVNQKGILRVPKSKQLPKKKAKNYQKSESQKVSDQYLTERSKLNSIMSKIIAQYANQNGPNTNDTIFFFSNLNKKTEDEKNGQFFNIPLGLQSNDLALQRKPKMSFFVSAPFEGQAVILNDSYVVQDTIIMRIDCDVTKTEYIGYGSDPSDLLNGKNGSSEIKDLEGENGISFGFDGETNRQGAESSDLSSEGKFSRNAKKEQSGNKNITDRSAMAVNSTNGGFDLL